MSAVIDFINLWFPWFSFLNDIFILQFFLLYTMYMVVITSNLYFILFYMMAQIVLFGIFLSLYQLEIFTAFLWLTEVVVVLVCLFLLFSTVPSGNIKKYMNNHFIHNNTIILFLATLISINYTYWILPEYILSDLFISFFHWDDYYEAVNNTNTNDLYGFYLSFYWFNSVEFILIGLVLLIGSLVCVQLGRFIKTNKTISYASFFDIYDFFKDIVKSLFLRKQNLVDQANSPSSTRVFKKKNKK
jgi:hypothetical protein